MVIKAGEAQGGNILERTAELTGLTPEQARIAVRYYADYLDEIDAWLRHIDEAARAEAAWQREQAMLRP